MEFIGETIFLSYRLHILYCEEEKREKKSVKPKTKTKMKEKSNFMHQ